MQNSLLQADAFQPFMKLMQANMELLTRYAFSPEAATEAMRNFQAILSPSQDSLSKLAAPQAFVGLVQGLTQNYTEFLAEISQTAYGAMFQGPLALMQQMQAAGSSMAEMATRGGKGR